MALVLPHPGLALVLRLLTFLTQFSFMPRLGRPFPVPNLPRLASLLASLYLSVEGEDTPQPSLTQVTLRTSAQVFLGYLNPRVMQSSSSAATLTKRC